MSQLSWRKHWCKNIQYLGEFLDVLKTFHNHQTCQSMATQRKGLWETLEAAFVNNLPHSESVKRQDFQVQAEKLSKRGWHLKGIVSKVLPDPVLKHSRVNQSPGSWVPWGPAWSYLFTYFTLFVALSGIIITLPLFSPSFYPYCALLVVNFCFLCGVDGRTLSLVLGRLLWINCGVTSAFPAWVPFYSPRTCWAFAVMLHC